MTLTRRDFRTLRLPLFGALILIIAASLIAWLSYQEAEKATRERNLAKSGKNQIEQRLRQVRTEERELKERAQLFRSMQDAGILGEEKRLEWTELLEKIQRELRIPGISYEFGLQKPLEVADGNAPTFYASPQRLQLRLLHEGDLLNFLTRLQNEARAQVLVRNCKLTPLASPPTERSGQALLAAECELQWVSVRQANGKK